MTQEFDEIKKKIGDFNDLLKTIKNVDDKKKQLWSEIYENAVSDRTNAFIMFSKLVDITKESSNEHAIHGRTMTAYIEKMSKANDQLVKLSELITKATETKAEAGLSDNDIFDSIRNSRK